MEEPGRLQFMGSLELDTTKRLHFDFSLSCIGEGNGNPLQCSCLENPGDGGAWWAVVYGVSQSRTRLKWLSSSSRVYLKEARRVHLKNSYQKKKTVVFCGDWHCCFCLVTQSCPTLCDPMDCSMPDFPVLHRLPEFAPTHVHWIDDAIQPSHPLLLPSPPALNENLVYIIN